MDNNSAGMVFNIQRYSIHDGPGIRTVVFLKGCPLRCLWCSNPESQAPGAESMFFDDKCTGCGACVGVCEHGARVVENGVATRFRGRCCSCGACAEACPNGAIRMAGSCMTLADVMKTVEKDRPFYDESDGGVTLSGGEPARQAAFAASILRRCHDRLIHTAIETTGLAAWTDMKQVVEHADLVLYDLKHMDSQKHRQFTGAPNDQVLSNARAIAEMGKSMIFRVPLIPGYNDDFDNLASVCDFAHRLGVREVDVLPYHDYGRAKYGRLGREYPLSGLGGLDPGDPSVARACEVFGHFGLLVKVGG